MTKDFADYGEDPSAGVVHSDESGADNVRGSGSG